MITYNPRAWFWQIGADTSQLWSSAAAAYVASEHEDVAAFIAAGGSPAIVASEAEVRGALAYAGLASRGPGYVPPVVDMWQARAALRNVGRLTAATAAVNEAGGPVRDAWEYGNTIRRDAPAIAAIGQALGLSDDDIDDLFRYAATVTV